MKASEQPDFSGGIELRGDEVAEFLWWNLDPDRRKTDLFLALGKRAAKALRVTCFSDAELRGVAWSACVDKSTEFGRQLLEDLPNLDVEGLNVLNAFMRAWAKNKAVVSKLVSRISSPGELEATLKLITERPSAGDEAKIKAHSRLADKLKPPAVFKAVGRRVNRQK